jgi:hypothetical protein
VPHPAPRSVLQTVLQNLANRVTGDVAEELSSGRGWDIQKRTCTPLPREVQVMTGENLSHAPGTAMAPGAENQKPTHTGGPGESLKPREPPGLTGASLGSRHFVIEVTTPAPTVRPPSRMAKRSPSSHAIGVISSTSRLMLSPGITISVPSGSVATPVTSVVRK